MILLPEERYARICDVVDTKGTVTVLEIKELLGTSESTIRRDLNVLHDAGKLIKVHGGATSTQQSPMAFEYDVNTKSQLNIKEKDKIGQYAASIINNDDFVFIDAGTTTEHMVDYITNTKATFVTNGIVHAKKLIQKGLKAYIIGGQLKLSTEAVVGAEALDHMKKHNFTKCFLGANGINSDAGFSTPDVEEALIKSEAVKRSFVTYILSDNSKFGKISSVSFANLDDACIVTYKEPDEEYTKASVVKATEKL